MSLEAVTSASIDLLGKTVDDLQENVAVGTSAITGTLKYVSDYTGFSGDVSEQSGNYIAVKASLSKGPTTLTAEIVGGVHGPVTLDSDGIVVCRITSTAQKIKITATNPLYPTITKEYALTGITLEPAPVVEDTQDPLNPDPIEFEND